MNKDVSKDQTIAHVRRDESGIWQTHPLEEHLQEVARLAGEFAARFAASDWARIAGFWHDLGKYRPRFQRYIRQASGYEPDAHVKGEAGRAPHSTAGALLAMEKLELPGRVLAYLIAGHHAGLYDWHGGLRERMEGGDARDEFREALAAKPPAGILAAAEAFRPDLRAVPGGRHGFALWVRMLFSCLVDADFLDTEHFMDPDKSSQRGDYATIPELLERLDAHMAAKRRGLEARGPLSDVNRMRAAILDQCRSKAGEPPGLFSLTVPTGGGKTLSSLAFALEHARQHGKRRVIYVIPYTSIIEQTADVFREIFANLQPDPVIEHHSNAETDSKSESHKSRLACENWDAPIIVTTNVQFFESLFAARTSRCRKLHNIVDSVVVLDEAHLLPPDFLQPVLDVLNLLTRHYGASVVLSTATQPALSTRAYFDPKRNLRGLERVRELMVGGPHVDAPDQLYRDLQRVDVTLPLDWLAPTSWDALAEEVKGHACVLAIVNRRHDARELFKLMPEGTVHLSALMCGAHRSEVIRRIKQRLKSGESVRVVSTQLVEAGVDLDFPVVYRALAGLDSIAQAAGRCNREGLLERGRVVVFIPPTGAPPGHLRKAEEASRNVLQGLAGDPLERPLFARYFERYYYACDLDAHGICSLLQSDGDLAVDFRTAAETFKLIDDQAQQSVIVRYGEAMQWLNILKKQGPDRWLMRKLQRYSVHIPRNQFQKLLATDEVAEVHTGIYAQNVDGLYDERLGFIGGQEGPNPLDLII
jgi:CRISPR-associated endonuclease/helicase Cas3